MKLSVIPLLALWLSVATATNSGDALFRAATSYIGKYTFECDKAYAKIKGKRVSGCQCWSPEYVATFYDFVTRTQNGNVERAFKSFYSACNTDTIKRGIDRKELERIYENATDYFISPKDVKNKTAVGYNPIKFTTSEINLAHRSWSSSFYQKHQGQLYGAILNAFFGLVIVLGALFNFFKKVFPRFVNKTTHNRISTIYRQKIANPALFGSKHSVPVKLGPFGIINASLPTRAQSIIITAYLALTLMFMLIKYDIFDGNTRFKTKSLQLSRSISDRSGIMAVTQLPLLYLFAGRNNMMLYVTGWSYDTFNVYHRIISRVMYALVVAHSIAYTLYLKENGTYESQMLIPDRQSGVVATVAGGFVLFLAMRHFREKLYEYFLMFHRLFVLIFTVSAYYHVKPHGFHEWMIASFSIWAFDLFIRFVRVVINGFKSKAELQTYGEEFVKFKVNHSGIWKPRPGAYAFVYFLRPFFRSWENHPFSYYPSPVPGEENKLVFCMRILNGKTKHMADFLASQPEGKCNVPVLLDGPYGQHFPVETSDSIVFIAGGIGFTGAYSYACQYKQLGEKKRIVFIWATRFRHNLEVFRDELNYLAQGDGIEVQVYITDEPAKQQQQQGTITYDTGSDNNSIPSKNGSTEFNEKKSFETEDSTSATHGLPNFGELVPNFIAESSGSTAFFCCGPPGLNDHVRSVVTDNMDKGSGRVELYIEGFNW